MGCGTVSAEAPHQGREFGRRSESGEGHTSLKSGAMIECAPSACSAAAWAERVSGSTPGGSALKSPARSHRLPQLDRIRRSTATCASTVPSFFEKEER